MRVALREAVVTLSPGQPTTVEVDVTNTVNAMDGVVARVVGLRGASVTTATPLLPLCPDSTGRIVLAISVPKTFPAGVHQAAVETQSAADPDQPGTVPLAVNVLPVPGAELTILPPVRRSRHRARFTVICANTGNTSLELALAASDPNRRVTSTFAPATVSVSPGESVAARLGVKARRRILGGDTNHAITIRGSAQDVDVAGQATFVQPPVIARAGGTTLVLAVIILLWLAAILFGLSKAW